VTRRVLSAAAALVISLSVLFAVGGRPASASVGYWQRVAALHWAESQVGKPYVYGGTGPYGYDCSGLVYAAFRRVGLTLPRTTYGMLGSWHLYRVYSPAGGDLAFYGSGHVELVALPGVTFGALHSGTTMGYHRWNVYWHPTAYYRVR
jgi:cell wall-associated NlpC family hydrolase